jgi:hypothetical protein
MFFPGIKKHTLRGRGLARVNVRADADVSDFIKGIIARHKKIKAENA